MTIEQLAVFTAKDLVRIEVTCPVCKAAVVFPMDTEFKNRDIYCPYCPEGDNTLWTEKEPHAERDLVQALQLAYKKSNPWVKLVVKMPSGG